MPAAADVLASAAPPRAVRVALAGDVPAAHAAQLVRGDARPFALVGGWAGASALAGSAPVRVAQPGEDPFALLDALPAVPDDAPGGFVGGGWFGVLGYGLGRRLEALGAPPYGRAAERLPEALLGFYDHLLRRDRDGAWWFEALWTDARAPALQARLEELRARVSAGVPGPAAVRTAPWRAAPGPGGHARVVQACRERIAAGDLFQANLALRLRSRLEDGEAADLFARGVAALAPDRAAWLSGDDGAAVASLSPELFVTRQGDVVRSAPIKGTRPRPADDPAAARALRDELAASAKDHAENVMIVDLVRNDLGRVCSPGTVCVTALAEVRPHAGVWHLVSEVVGRRRPGVGDGALTAAMFPPGSVTGAPKIAAMDTISALESAPRQAFCGAIGFASPAAGLELSVTIRTFELAPGGALWLDVGGGVVADSDPDGEAAECLAKARPLLAAIGAELAEEHDATAPAVALPPRLAARPVPRPDPATGIFETLLVRDGIAVAADRHLARLAASADELYGVALPASLAALVGHAALEQGGPCRLRVLLDPDGAVALDVAPLPAAREAVALAPVTVPGGLGPHKWRDRRLLDALERATGPTASPLLVDLDGGVLETSRSSLIVVLGDTLVSPAPDGRLLPGVTVARVLDAARAAGVPVERRPLALAELPTADGAFAVNALRGAEPVAAVGAQALRAPDDRCRTALARFTQLGE
jgi:para-aminobenzoate synthetase/4-amino-4-deoxychorismate lyase